MPTYAYRCSTCSHEFDIYQQFSDASLTECPECGGKLRKVFGSLGVTFNGSGFYRTDSRAAAGKAGASASGGGSASEGSSGAGSSSAGSAASSGSSSSSGTNSSASSSAS